MAHANKVVQSINQDGGGRCVDVFVRRDGSFGFEEYRREPEDNRGWFQVGFYADGRFGTAAEALAAATARVVWLADVS
jgi:hypothetical protein